MEATQKRRMWKVAIAHFVLSSLVIYLCAKFVYVGQGVFGDMAFQAKLDSSHMWRSILSPILYFLQPQRGLADRFFPGWTMGYPSWVVLFCSFSAPIWSICFSRILIRVKDWLNHFPVLGKRVF
jgi:hypothetical protein